MKAEFAKAILKVRQEIEPILKNSTNPFLKNKYANIEAVIDAVIPVALKNGIVVLQESWPEPQGNSASPSTPGITIATTLVHADSGETLTLTNWVALKDISPQGSAAAFTYGRRYGLLGSFVLATEDDDGNQAEGRSDAQPSTGVATPPAKPVATGKSLPKFG